MYVGHNTSGRWICRGREADLRSSWGDRVEDLLLNMWMEVRTWACRADRTSCSQDGIPENEGAKEQ